MNVEQLRATFSGSAWPRFEAARTDDNGYTLELYMEPSVRWFEGHFPDEPVLPGVVQTHWAAELGKSLFAIDAEFKRLDNLKFHTVIQPGQVVALSLLFDPLSLSLRFRYHHRDTLFSEGKFIFGNA